MGDLGHELYEEIRRQVECGKRHIYLTKPHFLYVTDEQSRLFEEATKNNPCYRDSLDEPIRSLLRENSPLLFKDITQAAHFIDLGPGYPSKSMALIDYFISKGTRVTYYAVDISRFFLERAVAAAHARGISSYPLNRRFEELGPILDRNLAPTTPRVIFIGLTFCNFDIIL